MKAMISFYFIYLLFVIGLCYIALSFQIEKATKEIIKKLDALTAEKKEEAK